MQRKFLEDLGLEKDTIDKIMDEHGKAVNREKGKADDYKSQLDTAKQTLAGFDGVDVSDLKNQISTLTTTLATKESEFNKKIAERDFNDMLSAKAKEYKARDIKSIKPFLDIDSLMSSKNQTADIDSAFAEIKKNNAYLFEDEQAPKVVSYTSGGNPDTNNSTTKANNALRSLFGKESN